MIGKERKTGAGKYRKRVRETEIKKAEKAGYSSFSLHCNTETNNLHAYPPRSQQETISHSNDTKHA